MLSYSNEKQVTMFDSTLMASSHPVITSYFNASNSASWLSTAFLLTSTSTQPLLGRLSDCVGRRLLYLSGIVFLAATTAWCALAQSIGSFIVARAFCGIGAAAVLSMSSVMTNDLVSIQVRGTYQAYINLFYGGGSAVSHSRMSSTSHRGGPFSLSRDQGILTRTQPAPRGWRGD